MSPLEDPPVCLASVVHYPFSTLGVYNEAIMLVRVIFEGEPYTFCPFIYVTTTPRWRAGVSCGGFPKSSPAWVTRARPPASRSASR